MLLNMLETENSDAIKELHSLLLVVKTKFTIQTMFENEADTRRAEKILELVCYMEKLDLEEYQANKGDILNFCIDVHLKETTHSNKSEPTDQDLARNEVFQILQNGFESKYFKI